MQKALQFPLLMFFLFQLWQTAKSFLRIFHGFLLTTRVTSTYINLLNTLGDIYVENTQSI